MCDISGAECMCGLRAASVPLSTSGHVSGSRAGPEGHEEFCSTWGAGEVVEKEGEQRLPAGSYLGCSAGLGPGR